MTKRLTAKDYKKQLEKITKEKTALEARIVVRARELCTQYPDVKITKILSVGEYLEINEMHPLTAIALIQVIEKHLADSHPHKQTSITF